MSQTAYDDRTHATLKHDWRFQETSGNLIDHVGSVDGVNTAGVTQNYTAVTPPFTPGAAGAWYEYDFVFPDAHYTECDIADIGNEGWAVEQIIHWKNDSVSVGLFGYLASDEGDKGVAHIDTDGGMRITFRINASTSRFAVPAGAMSLNNTYHIACGRPAGGSIFCYINGVAQSDSGTPTTWTPLGIGTFRIGEGQNSFRDNLICRTRLYITDPTNTTLPDAQFWADHYDDITAGAAGGSNIPAIMNHYRRLRAA